MSYRRFHLADVDLTSATVATLATVGLREPESVATVATVAGPRNATLPALAGVSSWSGDEQIGWKSFPQEVNAGPADLALTLATVATLATVRGGAPQTVATVAAPDRQRAIILSAYRRMFEVCAHGSAARQISIVECFLDSRLVEALHRGWSDVELFGCYPDPAFATVRYDCMGAVTIAALTRTPIATVSETEIRGESGLACRRPLPCHLAVPVWRVFPDDSEDATP